jgi:hypothetical protein
MGGAISRGHFPHTERQSYDFSPLAGTERPELLFVERMAMNRKELVARLAEIVKDRTGWDVSGDFEGAHFDEESTYATMSYSNSGVGEGYVLEAFQAEWPGQRIDMEVEGGCDSCGYGQRVTFTFFGAAPWETP